MKTDNLPLVFCSIWKTRKPKTEKINYQWREIVRIANTQKVVYTSAKKTDELIEIKKGIEPSNKLKEIYSALKIKN